MRNAVNPSPRSRSFLTGPDPSTAELDPYLIEETTITLDDWRHQAPLGDDAVVVRLHEHHYCNLFA
jgi:hypothetical protein